jgi:hypothetical protein
MDSLDEDAMDVGLPAHDDAQAGLSGNQPMLAVALQLAGLGTGNVIPLAVGQQRP